METTAYLKKLIVILKPKTRTFQFWTGTKLKANKNNLTSNHKRMQQRWFA